MKSVCFIERATLLLCLVAMAACAPGDGDPAGSPPPAGTSPPSPSGEAAAEGGVQAVSIHVSLSPQALIQAEKFMCVCGCGMRLAECTCQEEPGSVSMKRHLQELVDRGWTPSRISEAMVEKYGDAVLP